MGHPIPGQANLRTVRWILLVPILGLAAWTGGWDIFGLLWGGVSDRAAIFVSALSAFTLPISVLAIWRSRTAFVLFAVEFLLAYGYQMRVFKATIPQLFTNATGFVEHLILAFLLLCLGILDTVARQSRGVSSAPPGAA